MEVRFTMVKLVIAAGAVMWTAPANISAKGWFVNQVQAGVDSAGNVTAV